MEPRAPDAEGPVASLRALAATLLDVAGTRAELALVELREEGERRTRMLLLADAGGLLLALALLFAGLFVVFLYFDTHRLAAAGAVTLAYLAAAFAAFARLAAWKRASPPPFAATLRELAADRELLGGPR